MNQLVQSGIQSRNGNKMEEQWLDHRYKVFLLRIVNTGNGYWYKQNKGGIEYTKNIYILMNPVQCSDCRMYKLH
jgi:hypothetical protein